MSNTLITLRETAERVGYCRGYLKTLSGRGEFPEAVRLGGGDFGYGRIHFRAVEVRAWIDERKRTNNGKIHLPSVGKSHLTLERTVAELAEGKNGTD